MQQTRVFGLDILRAIAIVTVVYAHGHSIISRDFPNANNYNIDGVTLFFVLSGFLIGKIIINDFERQDSIRYTLITFWTRRWFRTLPAYFFTLALVIVAYCVTTKCPDDQPVARYIFFSQNLVWSHPKFFPEAWSLAVEEWFYLLLPISIITYHNIFRMRLDHAIIATAGTMLLVSCTFRLLVIAHHHITTDQAWDIYNRKIVFARLDSLMFGVLGALVSIRYAQYWIKYRYILAIFGVSLFVLDNWVVSNATYRNYFALTTQPLAALLLLPLFSQIHSAPSKLTKPIVFISTISYSLYLLHFTFVKTLLLKELNSIDIIKNSGSIMLYGMYWVLSILLAYLSWRYIERPALKIRDTDAWLNLCARITAQPANVEALRR